MANSKENHNKIHQPKTVNDRHIELGNTKNPNQNEKKKRIKNTLTEFMNVMVLGIGE
jgi:6-phosphogluconolactonase/glucosamine-6-phosphate isomerase/deaminase